MTTKDEALKLALEALEGIHPGNMTPMAEEYWNKAITAIKQALTAQPPTKEFTCSTGLCHYKAQRQWVGLSGEEIQTIWRHYEHMNVNEVCQAIEAKLKEKNT
jgi:hypothetical protein